MELSNEQLHKLEKYLGGDMTQDEILVFEAEIRNSDELQEYLEINGNIEKFLGKNDWVISNRKSEAFLSDPEISAFSDKIKSVRAANVNQDSKGKVIKMKWVYTIALAASLIWGAYILLKPADVQSIYAQHSTWSDIPTFVVKGDDENEKKIHLQEAFNEAEYKNAITLANELLVDHYQPDVAIYLGISSLELKKYDDARSTFQDLIDSKTLDAHKGYWYMVLTYLAQNDLTNTKKYLDVITANPQYYKYQEAKEISSQLN